MIRALLLGGMLWHLQGDLFVSPVATAAFALGFTAMFGCLMVWAGRKVRGNATG